MFLSSHCLSIVVFFEDITDNNSELQDEVKKLKDKIKGEKNCNVYYIILLISLQLLILTVSCC